MWCDGCQRSGSISSARQRPARQRTRLVRLIVVPAVEVLVQERHEARVPAAVRDQAGHVLEDVERVDPHVTLRPALVLACPRAAHIARLHEPGVVVENAEGVDL